MAQQTILGTDFVGKNTAPNGGLLKLNENYTDLYDNKLDKSGGTLTGLLGLGSGDQFNMWAAGPHSGFQVDARLGTSGAADIDAKPLIKAVRTSAHTQVRRDTLAGAGSDGVDVLATIIGGAKGTAASQVQPVGVFGYSIHSGTSNGASGGADACGLYGAGKITGAGAVGVALGAFLSARREVATGKVTTLELSVSNETTTEAAYSGTIFDDAHGIWITAGGQADSASGILFGKPSGRRAFDVGIGFLGGAHNPITDSSLRDDGNAARSIDIRGTHATAAIEVASGAGDVKIGTRLVFGDTSIQGTASQRPMTPTRSGAWVGPYGSSMGTSVISNEVARAAPFFVHKPMTFQTIGINVTVAGQAAGGTPVIRLGIYADDGNGYPGALVTDLSTVDVSTTGAKTIAYTGTLQPGTYYLVCVAQNCATVAPTVTVINPALPGVCQAALTDLPASYLQNSVTGALPANWTSTLGGSGVAPRVMLRIA